MKTKYKYLVFKERVLPDRKTKFFYVYNKYDNYLGEASWNAPWRKYCYTSLSNVRYDASCLADIQDFLNQLMAERKGKEA